MEEEIDIRKDKSVELPEFIQELNKLFDKYKDTLDKDDSVFIYSNIGTQATCLSTGRTLSQVTGLAQVFDMRDDVLNMVANAIIRHLKNKGDIAYTCALLSNMMDYVCTIPEMTKVYEKMNIEFLQKYAEYTDKRRGVN